MAKKNKKQAAKQQAQRRQKKQARRNARVGQRPLRTYDSTGSSPEQVQMEGMDRSVLQDAAPLISPHGGDPSEADSEGFMEAIFDTQDLADEPELEAIMLAPMVAGNAYTDAAQELGFTPETLQKVQANPESETHVKVMEKALHLIIERDKTLRDRLYQGLNRLRLRLKKERRLEDVPRVAGLQMMIATGGESDQFWALSGLMYEIFNRSMRAAAAFAQALAQFEDETDLDFDQAIENLGKGGPAPAALEKLAAMLSQTPGLENSLSEQMDKIWEEGVQALFMGKLHLDFFAEDEIAAGGKILSAALKQVAAKSKGQFETGLRSAHGQNMLEQASENISSMIAENITPQQIDYFNQQVRTVLHEHQANKRYWSAFLSILNGYIEKDPNYWKGNSLLSAIMIGEIRFAVKQEDEVEE